VILAGFVIVPGIHPHLASPIEGEGHEGLCLKPSPATGGRQLRLAKSRLWRRGEGWVGVNVAVTQLPPEPMLRQAADA
jgi:hypothetical protein